MDTKQYAVTHTDAEWRRLLTPEQYAVMRGHGTEAPGSCALNHEKRPGTFVCAGCALEALAGGAEASAERRGTGEPWRLLPVHSISSVHRVTGRAVPRRSAAPSSSRVMRGGGKKGVPGACQRIRAMEHCFQC